MTLEEAIAEEVKWGAAYHRMHSEHKDYEYTREKFYSAIRYRMFLEASPTRQLCIVATQIGDGE